MKPPVNDPPAGLVQWACRYAQSLHLRSPADRPWYLAPAPPDAHPFWDYACPCGRSRLCAVGYGSDAAPDILYLGQCRRCQTVVWSLLSTEGGCIDRPLSR